MLCKDWVSVAQQVHQLSRTTAQMTCEFFGSVGPLLSPLCTFLLCCPRAHTWFATLATSVVARVCHAHTPVAVGVCAAQSRHERLSTSPLATARNTCTPQKRIPQHDTTHHIIRYNTAGLQGRNIG